VSLDVPNFIKTLNLNIRESQLKKQGIPGTRAYYERTRKRKRGGPQLQPNTLTSRKKRNLMAKHISRERARGGRQIQNAPFCGGSPSHSRRRTQRGGRRYWNKLEKVVEAKGGWVERHKEES